MGYFDSGVSTAGNIDAQELVSKALSAGYETNPADMTGGKALIPEDLESTLTNILSETDNDCKLFGSLHKQPVKSTVHEITRRTGLGDYRHMTVAEGGTPREVSQELSRMIYQTKYLMTQGSITKQMELAETLEGAYESEKIAAVNRVALSAENLMFHGNSDVVPTEFDGLDKIIKSYSNVGNDEKKRSTVVDLHGLEIGETTTDADMPVKDAGRQLFNEIATSVYRKGGDLKRMFYAPELNMQFDRLYEDKLRYTAPGNFGMEYLNTLPTSIGSVVTLRGNEAGADKLFRVKGEVVQEGDPTMRPNAPASVTATANASSSNSKFYTSDAGDYFYAVHAVNAAGISAGTPVSTAVTVQANGSVTLTITPASNGPTATGFIITRSGKGGEKLMEMVSIAASAESTTTYTDNNDDLPGTGSIILLSATESRGRNGISFGQLLPISSVPLPIEANLNKRFVVSLFGMLEVRNPEHQALIKNIGYTGGLY